MPSGMTQAECRRLLFGHRLTCWGVHMHDAYTPAKSHDGQPSAKPVYYAEPVDNWLTQITEAFAMLAPNTPLRGVRFSLLTQKRFNPHQRALWYFYVGGMGDLTTEDRAKVLQVAGESKQDRALRDWRGDGRVGQALGVGGRQANRLRCEAVGLLATTLAAKWDRRAA